ncbi:hypothetical protein CJP74_05930 [Psittacicella melopsittaci]|uniref:YcjX family protein n=1 Tax=Psittacicella melopsittaci TaxID=2028576 RepID=A0A3A1Y2V4_9GAMM|nr:YcjX family protein [Psittacicella melopsittaci]RIY31895.1 hypothetical protein CJP74_05930 [Psittacicella melopsittaci]
MFKSLKEKYEQVFDQQLKIAVTGLSRSGKTAFITSFINQLLTLDGNKSELPFFQAAAKGWITGAQIVAQEDLTLPTFPYRQNILALKQEEPTWPQATTDISIIRLAIKYQVPRSLWRKVSEINFQESRTLYLDIVDYPGEWLLDLPLLKLDFAHWSASEHFLAHPIRQNLAQAWLAQLETFDPYAPANDDQLASIAQSFTEFLHACKAQGLEYIQPGRFVLPGAYANAPILQFFPLVNVPIEQWEQLLQHAKHHPTSGIGVLVQRYNTYVQTFVTGFYKQHFARFDRQIILVDCLTPLNHSALAFNETQLALEQIFQHFQYGKRNLWHRLFAPQIDKLVFGASKMDHITSDQVANLKSLLEQLAQNNNRQAIYQNIDTAFIPLAAIRATEQLELEKEGKLYKVLKGKSKESQQTQLIYPGEVPAHLPAPSFWQNHQFDFAEFAPLPLTPQGKIRSLGMDQMFEVILGDKLK